MCAAAAIFLERVAIARYGMIVEEDDMLPVEGNNKDITDVTFILPIRNEGHILEKTLNAIVSLPLSNCEVICVDSGSTDDSTDILKEYVARCPFFHAYRIEGYSNSAIARNIGLEHATKKYLFFLDGDVEVLEGFLSHALYLLDQGKAGAVTGQLREITYNDKYDKIIAEESDRFGITADYPVYWCGGCFVTTAFVTKAVGKFNERFVRNQDIEYTLRISRSFVLMAIAENMGTHHTTAYAPRLWKYIMDLYPLYYGVILRQLLLHPRMLLTFLLSHKGFFIGWFCAACLIAFGGLLLCGLRGYTLPLGIVAGVVATDMCVQVWNRSSLWQKFVGHYLYAPMVLLGLFYCPDKRCGNTTVVSLSKTP